MTEGVTELDTLAASLDHVGIVVSNLDEAVTWYRSALGCTVVWRQEPHEVPGAALGLPAGGVIRLSTAMLSAGSGGIELHEYLNPGTSTSARELQDSGIGHLAIAVSDIHAAAARLASMGVQFAAGPQHIESGPLAGRKWLYGKDPFGVTLELCQHPAKRPLPPPQ
jgi:lactoylglutathione lyase/glyoxylase I family protein